MEKQHIKSREKESSANSDLVKMQTEIALFESMTKSKTLTIMVVAGAVLFSGFLYLLYTMAGNFD